MTSKREDSFWEALRIKERTLILTFCGDPFPIKIMGFSCLYESAARPRKKVSHSSGREGKGYPGDQKKKGEGNI